MNELAVENLKSSFALVFAEKAQLAERFYAHLFDQLPGVRPLFTGDEGRQREMFGSMLVSSMRAMAEPGGIETQLDILRRSHARLGLTPSQLEAGANALMAALIEVMGHQLSDDEKSAWAEAIVLLVQAMAPPGGKFDGPDQTAIQMYLSSR